MLQQKNITAYTILGYIKNITYNTDGTVGSTMKIASVDSGEEHMIKCPFFCPARRDDVIKGYCEKITINQYKFVIEPVVEPNTSKDAVKTTFIIPLRGSHFGDKAAEKLYNVFENLAKTKIENSVHDNKDSILRNRNSLCHATMEVISNLAERYTYNTDALDILTTAGLTKLQGDKLLTWWHKNVSIRRLILLGLTKTEINSCVSRKWELSKLYYQLLTNPYLVIDISMENCKLICQKYNLLFSADMISAAQLARFIDSETINKKWACFPLHRLKQMYKNYSTLESILEKDFSCVIRNESFYLEHHKITEDTLCKFLTPRKSTSTTIISETSKLKLSLEQQEALSMALNNNISVITGGAGSGKSTLIKSIAHELDLCNISYVITAYTGKAVARLKQIFGESERTNTIQIMTLHMLIMRFKSIEREIKYIIVDEASMIPNQLFSKVLTQINSYNPNNDWVHTFKKREQPISIIIVGDPNQVQPIDWGDFFNQIQNASLPHIHLTIDYRRSKKSALFENVNAIGTTENKSDIDFKWGSDCNFIQGDIAQVESTFMSLIEKGYSHKDITIITPFNETVNALNPKIRDCIVSALPTRPLSITDSWNQTWYEGSRVICNCNRYEIGVMNGEEGEITRINIQSGHVIIKFIGHDEVAFPTRLPVSENLTEENFFEDNETIELCTKCINLCWAITIMKSQGSEWKIVILFFPSKTFSNSYMDWKLFYTGLSRAKDNLFIIANNYQNVLKLLLNNPMKRYDNLSLRLREITGTQQSSEIVEEYIDDDTDVIEIPW